MNRPTRVAWLTLALIAATLDAEQRGSPPPVPGAVNALDPRWTLSIAAPLNAPAGFDQQMAYVALKDGALTAIGLDDGVVRWQVSIAATFTPATGDGLVFVGSGAEVTALDQTSGRTMWHADVGGALSGPLFWDGGWLVASTESGELVALAATDGRVAWRNPLGSPLAVRPATAEDRLFVALRDGRVAAVSVESGDTLWTSALDEPVSGLLALPEQLLVGTRANRLHSLSPSRGRNRWTQKAGADVVGAPAADDDRIYFVAFDNSLRALDRGSGNLEWTRHIPSRPSSGPLITEHVVLVPFTTPVIGAYLAKTGAEAFSIRAIDELRGAPFLREQVRPTMPRLITVTRLGALQAFAARFEAPPAALTALPGTTAAQ